VPFLARAAELAPDDASMKGPLAGARILPYLEAQRARAPRDTAVLFKLAEAYALTQQYDSARATLSTLLAAAPGHAQGRALLAQLPR
jgi:hypothetical protein